MILLLALIHVAEDVIVDDETAGGLPVASNEGGIVLCNDAVDGLLHLDLETATCRNAAVVGAAEGLEALQGGGLGIGIHPLSLGLMAKDDGLHHYVSLVLIKSIANEMGSQRKSLMILGKK